MGHEVRCECGKRRGVTAADAGASLPCGCGRTVEVPPLHQLRTAAGEEVLSPAVRIQTLLLEKKLPGTRECAVCFRETDDLVHVSVECEVGRVVGRAPNQDSFASGCLVVFGGLPGLLLAGRLRRDSGPLRQVGQDVGFTVPLPACEVCQPNLDGPAALRVALRHVPEYAALLKQYPHARVTRAG